MSLASTIGPDSFKTGSKRLGRTYLRTKVQVLFDFLVGFWIFTGCLVFVEPSPYEVSFLLVLPFAFLAGMGVYRSTLGLLAMFVAFIPFALVSAFQARVLSITDEITFVIVTAFLLLTSYFVANYVAEQTARRMRLVMNAYTAAALISAVIGTLAYLGLMPSADTFLLYGRAKAMFNDPNVFGPFLILPAMYALQRVLLG
ncbi:MAG: O-antigen ligase family protein, partial [Devosia sp.]|nr:O-antigen ligase family protein [Devosia sp.]